MLDLPVGKQRYSILNSNARINLFGGSVRAGKTIASILRWIQYCIEGPEGNLLMIGKTQRSLEHNVLDVISDLVGIKNYRYNRVAGEVYIYGRKCYAIGANDEKAKDKIQGITAAGAYGDELPLWPYSFFTMLLSRLSVKNAKGFFTYNAESPRCWLKVNYIDRIDELNLKNFVFTLEDNKSLDPEYVENLKKEYVGLWYSRYILGLWVAATGAVYDSFDINKNVVNELPKEKFDKIYCSVDYGTANATCFLLFGRSKGRWYVYKEYYYDSRKAGRQKTDKEYANDLVEFLDSKFPQKILIDPSASSYKTELRSLKKYRVGDAQNEVLDGIRITAKALQDGNLLIYKNCTKLIEQIQSYTWDEKKQSIGIDFPVKTEDHACDSLRYGAIEIFNHNYNKMPVDLPKR
ncbi:MAG: PBSX family phage terminase large subunit [Methanothrix sp.]|jgi:PBSX family phage terminase large subunit|nr:PBSX family phage terminase large subunit [Methanothrix sp.]